MQKDLYSNPSFFIWHFLFFYVILLYPKCRGGERDKEGREKEERVGEIWVFFMCFISLKTGFWFSFLFTVFFLMKISLILFSLYNKCSGGERDKEGRESGRRAHFWVLLCVFYFFRNRVPILLLNVYNFLKNWTSLTFYFKLLNKTCPPLQSNEENINLEDLHNKQPEPHC